MGAETIAATVTAAIPAHWDILRQDLAYTIRALGRTPGFTVTALTVTALCIGATTAAFSLADHALLRPLPFPDPDCLVKVWQDDRRQGYGRFEPSPGNYRDWTRRARSFDKMAAYSLQSMNLSGDGEPQRLDGAAVNAGLMELLGAQPLAGRLFTAADDTPGSPGTVLLSNALWRERYGGDRAGLGRARLLDKLQVTGIRGMPPAFALPAPTIG